MIREDTNIVGKLAEGLDRIECLCYSDRCGRILMYLVNDFIPSRKIEKNRNFG